MTTMRIPKFIDSPYFVMEMDNWHLKDGAPAEVVREFNEYMEDLSESERQRSRQYPKFEPIEE